MKYLKSIFEWAPPAIEKTEPQEYIQLNRDELLALANSAIDAGNFKELAKINQALATLGHVPMSHLETYESWNALTETIHLGKEVLQDLADAEIKSRTEELRNEYAEADPEERKQRIRAAREEIVNSYLKHPDFLEIQKLLHKSPTYIGTFVKFRFLQGAEMETIRDLAKALVDYRDNLKDIPIEEYGNMKPELNQPDTWGWNLLSDEFTRLRDLRGGKWIVDSLTSKARTSSFYVDRGYSPVNQRELYRQASKEKKEELLRAASSLNSLNKPEFIAAINKAMGSFESIDKIIDAINTKTKIANTDRGKIESLALQKYPSVAVVYSGEDQVVYSFRNELHIPELCPGGRAFCLNPKWAGGLGLFWNYADGSVQLMIVDYSMDPSSPFYTVGVTIGPDKRVSSLCDAQNYPCISGGDYRQFLLEFTTKRGTHAYPKSLIDSIEEAFDREVEIKKVTDPYYKEFSKFEKNEVDREKAMLARLEGVIQNFGNLKQNIERATLSKSALSINNVQSISNQILAQELSNFKASPVIIAFRKKTIASALSKGLHSPAEVKIFDMVLKDSPELTESVVKNILAINTKFLALVKKNTVNAKLSQREVWDNIINGLQDATTYLEKLELELKNK